MQSFSATLKKNVRNNYRFLYIGRKSTVDREKGDIYNGFVTEL